VVSFEDRSGCRGRFYWEGLLTALKHIAISWFQFDISIQDLPSSGEKTPFIHMGPGEHLCGMGINAASSQMGF
jgi:hypothetical protein